MTKTRFYTAKQRYDFSDPIEDFVHNIFMPAVNNHNHKWRNENITVNSAIKMTTHLVETCVNNAHDNNKDFSYTSCGGITVYFCFGYLHIYCDLDSIKIYFPDMDCEY